MCATTRHAPRRTPRVVSLSPASLPPPPPPPPQARPNPNICLSDVRLKQTSQPKSPKWRSPARFLRPNTVFAAAAARYTFLRVSLSLSLSSSLSALQGLFVRSFVWRKLLLPPPPSTLLLQHIQRYSSNHSQGFKKRRLWIFPQAGGPIL